MQQVNSDKPIGHAQPTGHLSESGRLGMLAIILGGAIALAYLSLSLGERTNFEDAVTFGAGTSSVMASVDGYRIHCGDSRDAAECLAGAKGRHAERSVLWLGNSQLHAVNQLREGETNATPLLFDRLRADGLDLVTFSQPNASLQEHLVLFEYLVRQLPMKLLILPVVLDDTREDGLRKEVADFLQDGPTRLALAETAIGLSILGKTERASPGAGEDTAGIAHTLQERFERFLNTWLDAHSKLWAARPELRGRLMLDLFFLRNDVLGITPTSKRKVIRGRYQANMAALEAILGSAASRGITVLLYVVPLRNDAETPYVESEYIAFKDEVLALANRYGAIFANLENLVPSEFWGSKDNTSSGGALELDFMHFQAGGHKLLAGRLAELVTGAWTQRGAQQ